MKKLLAVLGISLVILSMTPLTSAHLMNKPLIRHHLPATDDGSYSGTFFMKNETGWVPLGEFSGTYSGSNWSASYDGTWYTYDGNSTGTMTGMVWGRLFFGQMNVTGSDQGSWYIGLFDVNSTDSSFRAVSVIFGGDDNYAIRYALGSL